MELECLKLANSPLYVDIGYPRCRAGCSAGRNVH